jgi:DNA-directed RNA polymerase specialized sigma24 family protein
VELSRPTPLSHKSFAALLMALDPDPAAAAVRYEKLRRRLVTFFRLEGVSFAEDRADEAISRVARRLEEGEPVRELEAYVAGVARLLLKEAAAEAQRSQRAMAEFARRAAGQDPDPHSEIMSQCLEECLRKLPDEQQEFILSYYSGSEGARIRNRNELAKARNIPVNALRNRALRIRRRLLECVRRCLRPRESSVMPRFELPQEDEGPSAR